ncbi:mitochondrial matrix iron-sulfur protein [Mucor velutinosus]|uniref:Mitochondrial matrix iron-sulfur protein n=1 Tax=Mucor velutinosus TaxID=708070 RepID=A0AAN7DE22_9FUNG|nr:mitochondrial matrix iron-sulfur protein [Mucor velutinosus]
MDTNYKEQLIWYENTVKPYAVRPISVKTRVWHASATKVPSPSKQLKLARSSRNSNDNNKALPTARLEPSKPTRDEASAEQFAIWTTNMETDNEEQESCSSLLKFQTTIDADSNLKSSKQSDKHLIDLNASNQKPIISDSVAEVIGIITQLEWISATDSCV